jgi:hypothetical protein
LRAHGVGHVDHRGQEQDDQHVGLEATLERADEQRGGHGADQAEQKPRQSVP